MSQQSFQVMITDHQYRELQHHQQENKTLLSKIEGLQLQLAEALNRLEGIENELHKKNSEIDFLRTTLELFAQLQPQEESSESSLLGSNVFEVLAQSRIEVDKSNQSEQKALHQQFLKKYQNTIKKIADLAEKFRSSEKMTTDAASRQELVTWLQKETDDLRTQNQNISFQLSDYANRIKDLQLEVSTLKQGLGNSTFYKDETKDKIKALIEDYARQVENNLKSIEGLCYVDIADLMASQMNEIASFITNRKPSQG